MAEVLVVVEQAGGAVKKVTLEMLTLARQVGSPSAVVLGAPGTAAAVADIRRGGDREKFKAGGYPTLPGWSYRSQWWISHDGHGAFAARGVHGQAIYVDPAAEMVIARFGSHPLAGNANLDPMTLPAFRALADHLLRQPKP